MKAAFCSKYVNMYSQRYVLCTVHFGTIM